MSEIEKMKRYIERTKMGRADNYALAFDYGKAKGYRAAKAEGRARA